MFRSRKETLELDALLEWAFGAGAQAITPVGRHSGRYFEHRISWYREAGPRSAHARSSRRPFDSPDAGARHPAGRRHHHALLPMPCHGRETRTGPERDAAGVTCERCHGPGAAHVAKPSTANIVKSRQARCAVLRRMPSSRCQTRRSGSVRFQPVGLTASRCFQASGTLSCVTCHNPHADASQDAASTRSAACPATPPSGVQFEMPPRAGKTAFRVT